MNTANQFFITSLQFSVEKLLADLAICQQKAWVKHFNTRDFTGTWTSFALRSISGEETDILATPNSTFQDTPTLEKCPYFKEIIDLFECPKEAVRLLSLSPNSYIKEHRDVNSGYEAGFFRIHVPIQTNEKVIFTVNGQALPMKVGECWYANFDLPHYVSNEGEKERIHLVIDCVRNEWSDSFFAKLGYDFEAEKVRRNHDTKTKLLMIEQLSMMNTQTAHNMMLKLREEIEKAANSKIS